MIRTRDPLRLVVADHSAIVRDGLSHLLETHGHEIAATAAGDELLDASRTHTAGHRPDRHPHAADTNHRGLAAAAIRVRMPEVGVLILSQHVDADYALKLLREHPSRSGHLLTERITQLDTLLNAVDRVCRGESIVDREFVGLLLRRPADKRPARGTVRPRTRGSP